MNWADVQNLELSRNHYIRKVLDAQFSFMTSFKNEKLFYYKNITVLIFTIEGKKN